MATDWAAEKLSFYNDIRDEGFEVTVKIKGSPGTFNPVTLVYDGATAASTTTTYAIRKEYKARDIDGTNIQIHDCQLVIPSYGLLSELSTAQEILIDGVVQNVFNIKKIALSCD